MICTFYKKLSAGDHYIILHKVKTFKILNDKNLFFFLKVNNVNSYKYFSTISFAKYVITADDPALLKDIIIS